MKFGRHKEQRDGWLEAFPDVRKKYLRQCVVCQEIGYDLAELEKAEKPGILKNLREYLRPLEVNEIGVCKDCADRMPREPDQTRP